MTKASSINLVAGVWLVLFVVALLIPVWMYHTDWVGKAWFDKILEQVNRSYVPYVGAILSFYFAAKKNGKLEAISLSAPVVAILSATVWNAINLYFIISIWKFHLQADAAIDGMDKYSSMFSWLVAPGMGFFFGSHFVKPREPSADAATPQQ